MVGHNTDTRIGERQNSLFLAVLKQKCCQAELYRGLPPGTGEQQVGAVRGSISMARR